MSSDVVSENKNGAVIEDTVPDCHGEPEAEALDLAVGLRSELCVMPERMSFSSPWSVNNNQSITAIICIRLYSFLPFSHH